jgi:hypothetical protein
MLFPWVHLIMKDDNEARSFTTGAMVSRDPSASRSKCEAEQLLDDSWLVILYLV